ncbi:MAG: hypothetical protein AB4426_22490 [Xenococcaceae cyanobacterium]
MKFSRWIPHHLDGGEEVGRDVPLPLENISAWFLSVYQPGGETCNLSSPPLNNTTPVDKYRGWTAYQFKVTGKEVTGDWLRGYCDGKTNHLSPITATLDDARNRRFLRVGQRFLRVGSPIYGISSPT